MPDTRLIAIDWGTTSARAYWLDGGGRIVDERNAPLGIQKIIDRDFAGALARLCGELPGGVPLLACGMIGSRQGWIETPYRDCPAGFGAIAAMLTVVPGTRVHIVPGLICRDRNRVPDVMRGEETPLFGALPDDLRGRRAVVLPGTHSKWAIVSDSAIETFATFMTGELYAVLREHSILGRLAAEGRGDGAAFERGVRLSLRDAAAMPHDLFSPRTLALTGAPAPLAAADYLSGLLLGAEVAAGRRWLERHAGTGGSVIMVRG